MRGSEPRRGARRARAVLVASVTSVALATAGGGCAGDACFRHTDCAAGETCKAGRCVPAKEPGVDAGADVDAVDGGADAEEASDSPLDGSPDTGGPDMDGDAPGEGAAREAGSNDAPTDGAMTADGPLGDGGADATPGDGAADSSGDARGD